MFLYFYLIFDLLIFLGFNFEKYFYSDFILLSSHLNSLYNILAINIFSYVLVLIFFFFFLSFFKTGSLKYLNILSHLTSLKLFKIFLICIFLNMAGIPPLLGFFAKTLIFFFIFKSNFFFILVFFCFNLLALFFYLLHLKLFLNKKNIMPLKFFLFKLRLNRVTVKNLNIGFFFLLTSFFFLDSCFIILSTFFF